MKHSRLIQKFEKFKKSSKNIYKNSNLVDQIEYFQFLEDENFCVNELEAELNNKYSRLKKGD